MSAILLAAIVQLGAAPDAPSVLDVRDGHHFTILDPATGSVWITPRFSNGMTARQAVAAFPGFRLAKRDEVLAMFAHAGLPQLEAIGNAVPVPPEAVHAFQQLMDDSQNVVGTYLATRRTIGQLGIRNGALVDVRQAGTLDTGITFEGHWLIRPGAKRSRPAVIESWLKYDDVNGR